MHDAADGRVALVKRQVRQHIGGRAQIALNRLVLKVNHDHVFSMHFVIIKAAGLDDHQARFPVPGADIAPGIGDQAAPGQLQIGIQHQVF